MVSKLACLCLAATVHADDHLRGSARVDLFLLLLGVVVVVVVREAGRQGKSAAAAAAAAAAAGAVLVAMTRPCLSCVSTVRAQPH
jgi:hypothetical protein